MSSTEQTELFPDPPAAEIPDAGTWAEEVAAAGARRGPVQDGPPSEAALDQGWGPVERRSDFSSKEVLGGVALVGEVIDADEPVLFGRADSDEQNAFNAERVRTIKEQTSR